MIPRWFGAAFDLGLAAASAFGLPVGEAGKVATSGYKLYDKLREKQRAGGLNDPKLIGRTQTEILNGWLTQAQGEWLTETDANAADALLDRHMPDCLPSLAEMAGLAGTSDRAAATVELALNKLAVKDTQFRDNHVIRRFAEEVLDLIIREVSARPEFRSLLITHDIEAMARAQLQDRERGEAFQGETSKHLAEIKALLAQSAQGQAAIRQGVDPEAIVAIAVRLNPDVSNGDQALVALERAAAELLQLRAERDAGTNLGDLVDTAVRRIAARFEASDPDGAQAEGARAFADWRQRKAESARREAERRDAEQAAGIKLAQETERAAYLAGDAEGVAQWIGEGLALAADAEAAPLSKLAVAHTHWWERGRDHGLNLDLDVAVAIANSALRRMDICPADRGVWQNNLGNALQTLGARETGTVRLERAVGAYEAALREHKREREPLQWALTQNNLGAALQTLGERATGTARLVRAVAAYEAALLERTRERVPLQWATTQNNLGNALRSLGERETGTARLEQAVMACEAALLERKRERVPLQWATTQNNLGNALRSLGERETGATRLGLAVKAYEAALLERTRERVPLDWAGTQINLGIALQTLGARETGTVRLAQAVTAYEAALLEYTRERAPHLWATTQINLGVALCGLGRRETGTARLERAVTAYEAALLEYTRERAPHHWAMTQNNLANAELALAGRTAGTKRQALLAAAMERARSAQEVFVQARAGYYVQKIEGTIADIEAELVR
jgi:hypothetical protein